MVINSQYRADLELVIVFNLMPKENSSKVCLAHNIQYKKTTVRDTIHLFLLIILNSISIYMEWIKCIHAPFKVINSAELRFPVLILHTGNVQGSLILSSTLATMLPYNNKKH